MKSPLKSRPLRSPGESLDRQIEEKRYDGALQFILVALVMWLIAGYEWLRWIDSSPPHPEVLTGIAILLSAYAVYRTVRTRKELRDLRLGRDGEKFVGQFLEALRSIGAEVFHDVPGAGFNVDHVMIHSTGIYVIETKMRSKPEKGETRLIYDGQAIRKGNATPDAAPIIQAKAASAWIKGLMSESTGKNFPIRPVVLFPGWYIERTGERKASDVWVLNPDAFKKFISYEKPKIVPDDVKLCAFHLSRYVMARYGE